MKQVWSGRPGPGCQGRRSELIRRGKGRKQNTRHVKGGQRPGLPSLRGRPAGRVTPREMAVGLRRRALALLWGLVAHGTLLPFTVGASARAGHLHRTAGDFVLPPRPGHGPTQLNREEKTRTDAQSTEGTGARQDENRGPRGASRGAGRPRKGDRAGSGVIGSRVEPAAPQTASTRKNKMTSRRRRGAGPPRKGPPADGPSPKPGRRAGGGGFF